MKDKLIMNNGKVSKDTITMNDRGYADCEKDKIHFNVSGPKTIEERKAILVRDYSEVVVHDFQDEYHMSEEEKRSRSAYYEAYQKLRQCKRKYRKIGEFVKVMRLCLECLDAVAKNNGVYQADEFKEKVISGEITVNGLNFPKYVGKDRRKLNWDLVSNYITNDILDYKELERTKSSISDVFDIDFDDDDELNELMISQYGKEYDEVFGDDETVDIDERTIKKISKKDNGAIVKALPEIQEALKNTRKKLREGGGVHNYVYQISKSDFDYIEDMDKRLNVVNKLPKFKGDIMDDDDYNRYMRALSDWEEEKIHVSYDNKLKTLEEAKELAVKAALEEGGWNIRSFYKASVKAEEKKLKKDNKRDKKEEKKLKKKLTKLQSARDKRNGDDDMINSKKKKKKDKKKKKKDKGDD